MATTKKTDVIIPKDADKKKILEEDVEEDEESIAGEEEEESEIEEEEEDEDEGDVAIEEEEEESEIEEEPSEGEGEEGEGEAEEGEEAIETAKTTKPAAKKSNKRTVGLKDLKTKAIKSIVPSADDIDNDEDDDDDDEDIENYLQKFDNSLRNNFILNHHPEANTHNYEEVKALSRVTRDGRGIIVDAFHKTIPILTKYEMTRVVGQRAKQLDSGAKAFVKVPLNVIDGYHIAMLELEQKKLPFIIKRPYPNGGVEYWCVSDLEIL